MLAPQESSHHHAVMRTTTTTHRNGHRDRTTLVLGLLGVALLGLLALLRG